MNAGLLFYLARKTSQCQREVGRCAAYFDIMVPEAAVCAKETALRPAIAQMIYSLPVVFVVSGSQSSRLCCAQPLFQILQIPLDSDDEPKGVLRLKSANQSGYLIESLNQAIVLLPDEPGELAQMLPQAFSRLKTKFKLDGELPKPVKIDYEALVETSMNRIYPKE